MVMEAGFRSQDLVTCKFAVERLGEDPVSKFVSPLRAVASNCTKRGE
jgi:hypothetical protein